jgi:hypothetical protein
LKDERRAGRRAFFVVYWQNKIGVPMSKLTTEKYLVRALLNDGAMSKALFEEELEDQIDEFLKSKQEDQDDYFFAITENKNHVAMLLIDRDDNVHVNEEARAKLKTFWQNSVYENNMEMLIPQMVDELSEGYYFVTGVKVQKDSAD